MDRYHCGCFGFIWIVLLGSKLDDCKEKRQYLNDNLMFLSIVKGKNKRVTLRRNCVECLDYFSSYSITSTVTPDLNSTVNLFS